MFPAAHQGIFRGMETDVIFNITQFQPADSLHHGCQTAAGSLVEYFGVTVDQLAIKHYFWTIETIKKILCSGKWKKTCHTCFLPLLLLIFEFAHCNFIEVSKEHKVCFWTCQVSQDCPPFPVWQPNLAILPRLFSGLDPWWNDVAYHAHLKVKWLNVKQPVICLLYIPEPIIW